MNVLLERVRMVRTVAARVTVVPAVLRIAVFLCGLGGLAVAFPAQLLASRLVGLLVVVAVWPAVAPRGRGATALILLGAGGWLADTLYGQSVRLGSLLALATLLYLVHSLTALAAVLPYDAVVAGEVVAHWLGRAVAVVTGSAVLIVLVLSVVRPAGGAGSPALAVTGFAGAVAVAGLLTWLVRRP